MAPCMPSHSAGLVQSPTSPRPQVREQPRPVPSSSTHGNGGKATAQLPASATSPSVAIQDSTQQGSGKALTLMQPPIDGSSVDEAATQEPSSNEILGSKSLDKARLIILYALTSIAGLVTLGLCIAWPQLMIFLDNQPLRVALVLVNAGCFFTIPSYFQCSRRAVYPMRLVCMHLLQEVIAAEAKEGVDRTSWIMPIPREVAKQNLAGWSRSHLKKSQRREYKKARKAYADSKVQHRAKSANSVSPIEHSRIIWLHQCRKSSSPVLEFLERWGLLFVFDGTLDEFYIDGDLVAFSLTAQAGNSYQCMLYFSVDRATRCGIYHYCTLTSVSRALNDPSVSTICVASGTDHAKKNLGYVGKKSFEMSIDEIQAMYGCKQSLFFTEVNQTHPLWMADGMVWE